MGFEPMTFHYQSERSNLTGAKSLLNFHTII